MRVDDPADYLPALKEGMASGGPFVIDVVTDPEAYPPITAFDTLDALRVRLGR